MRESERGGYRGVGVKTWRPSTAPGSMLVSTGPRIADPTRSKPFRFPEKTTKKYLVKGRGFRVEGLGFRV